MCRTRSTWREANVPGEEAGYATGHFGKWHLGPVRRESLTNPGAKGFEEWLSHDNFFELDPPLVRNGGDPKVYKGESSQIVVEAATEFLSKTPKAGQPFFVVVRFGSPHGPYRGIAKDLELYKNVEDEELRHRWAEITAMSDDRYELVERAKGTLERFDMVANAGETKDLSKERPEIAKKMRKALKEWQASVERSLAGYDY